MPFLASAISWSKLSWLNGTVSAVPCTSTMPPEPVITKLASASAAITGAWVALNDCLKWMQTRDMIREGVLRDHVAAVSCGLYKGAAVLDLDYAEDSSADADANFVMTGTGGIVEVQGTAETVPFSQEGFDQLMALAKKGIAELVSLQKLTVA